MLPGNLIANPKNDYAAKSQAPEYGHVLGLGTYMENSSYKKPTMQPSKGFGTLKLSTHDQVDSSLTID